MDSDIRIIIAIVVVILGMLFALDWTGKERYLRCVDALKDRPAAEILAVCK